ncbi:MAG: hypothetical protein HKN35_03355 [Woeseia sp.]|nr:hypothetical protein [Woeseia sp.]MBT8097888.1 hypothetical protein [Woeseia sp.]NNE59907.1 hypothetical protein [Woeseia sp.]NNL54280.1 hypothetical protein [Woeseia sp.]
MKTLMFVSTIMLCACGGADDHEPTTPDAAPFDELTESIEKAEAVEQQMQEQKDRLDRALQDAEQPPN